MGSMTMIEEPRNELERLEAVELKVLRQKKSGARLEAEVQALRLSSDPNKLGGPGPSSPATLDDLRSGFQAEIATASEVLRAEISLLKPACLASISGVFGTFQRSSSTIFSKDSSAFWVFPAIFEDFKDQKFTLLWRGSRDGFKAKQFHRRCDGHPNTLTVLLDTDGNIFGGFTPVDWESRTPKSPDDLSNCFKADRNLKSFIFTLKNPHSFPPRRFMLKEGKKEEAIACDSEHGPYFGDILVTDNCSANADSSTSTFGDCYADDTGLADEGSFFTGRSMFKVREIEVF
jgi:hypothetical protein